VLSVSRAVIVPCPLCWCITREAERHSKRDITLSELAIEAFFPADSETAAIMQHQAPARGA
jgi:hypothetical protein